ncbi:hypothetical protein COLO4_28639 [Corchorus olitorius]|uniref:Uncharacterized protein n=1 Tax=Corchorus olitorius TaxID=93759 RepID=A0A1R3HJ45_9ROSI|nr:hypothetical protein COLO4_28639 [Corchorus olitorius]
MLANLSGVRSTSCYYHSSHFKFSNRCKPFISSNCPRLLSSKKSSKFCSLSLLLNGTGGNRFAVRALLEPEVSDSVASATVDGDGGSSLLQPVSVKIPFGDREILVETGHIGRQASGSVMATDGETVSAEFLDVASEPSDFFPLSVNYQERFSAAGRTSGGFFKREGRTKDHEVLICRLIDRPLRPTMPKGFYHETQLLSWHLIDAWSLLWLCATYSCKAVILGMGLGLDSAFIYILMFIFEQMSVLSYDGLHSPDALAVTAAGIAVALSELPNSKAIAGVRVGLLGEKFVVNPTTEEMENSTLDLFLAGTDSAILMIEGYCEFLPEEKLLEAVQVGQLLCLHAMELIHRPLDLEDAVRAICTSIDALVEKCGKPKMFDAIKLPPPELYRRVEFQNGSIYLLNDWNFQAIIGAAVMLGKEFQKCFSLKGRNESKGEKIAGAELHEVLQIRSKIPRRKAISLLEEKVINKLTEKGYISTQDASGTTETIQDLLEDEDEDEEIVVDGEVDEGDVHIKPVSRKSTPFFTEVDVKLVFKEVSSKILRRRIVEGGKRSDGRSPEGIRPITSRCGLLPRAHGSALFTRGETQLSTATPL